MSEQTTTQRIEALKSMEADWDGCGACKPEPSVLAHAASMSWLNELPTPSGVWPGTGGVSVVLSWDEGPGEVELHISERGFGVEVCYELDTAYEVLSRDWVLDGLRKIGVQT